MSEENTGFDETFEELAPDERTTSETPSELNEDGTPRRRRGGKKRSSWFTFRRRLLLVRLLLRGPASKEELIEGARMDFGAETYPEAAESALKHDLDSLKREFNCKIGFQRATGRYILRELGDLALLELPDPALDALAFLDATFPAGSPMPEHANVRMLLEKIVRLLPIERQEVLNERQTGLTLAVNGNVPNRIDRVVLLHLRRAIEYRQEVTFDYHGPLDIDGPRRHRVHPYHLYFKPEGHGYLDATLIETTPAGAEPIYSAIDYRLDRIVPGSVRILPSMLPPQRIEPPTYQIRYELTPAVARRRDVASYFPRTEITYHDDGSATVTAEVTNLWQTRQTLLRYGDACRVIEPPPLVELFRQTAEGLSTIYERTSSPALTTSSSTPNGSSKGRSRKR